MENHSELYSYWYRLVKDYARREITRPSDLLAGIAGLAQQVAKRLPEDLYVMGLWLFDLNNGLLWTAYPEQQKSSPKMAPSWSWLSRDAAQYDMCLRDDTVLYETSRAPTFFFLSAIDKDISPFPVLRVLAPLVRVKRVHDYKSHGFYGLDVCDERLPLADPGTKREEFIKTALLVHWDQYYYPKSDDLTFRCLLLGNCHQKIGTSTCGLILECVDSKMNLYRRMGNFRIRKEKNDISEAVRKQFHGLEKEEFYIK